MPILHLNGDNVATRQCWVQHQLPRWIRCCGIGYQADHLAGDDPKTASKQLARRSTRLRCRRAIQRDARKQWQKEKRTARFDSASFVAMTCAHPKGWTGTKVVDGSRWRALGEPHQSR